MRAQRVYERLIAVERTVTRERRETVDIPEVVIAKGRIMDGDRYISPKGQIVIRRRKQIVDEQQPVQPQMVVAPVATVVEQAPVLEHRPTEPPPPESCLARPRIVYTFRVGTMSRSQLLRHLGLSCEDGSRQPNVRLVHMGVSTRGYRRPYRA